MQCSSVSRSSMRLLTRQVHRVRGSCAGAEAPARSNRICSARFVGASTTPSSAPILPPPPLARHARKVFTRHASTTANTGRPSAASTGKQKVSDRPMVSRTQPLSSRRSVQRCSSTTAKRLSLVRIYLSDTVHVCIARGTSCARNKRYRSPAARAVQTTWRSHKARQVSQRWPARSHTRSMTPRRSVRPL